jgi:hypothetical protein
MFNSWLNGIYFANQEGYSGDYSGKHFEVGHILSSERL